MNVKEYIASGTLELYVAGVLPPEEKHEVEKFAALYPEIREEILKIGDLIENYSEIYSKQPRPELKDKIMAAIDALPMQKSEPLKVVPKTQEPAPGVIVRNIHTRTGTAFKYLAAAMVTILLTTNIVFFSKWQRAEGELQTLVAQNYQLAQSYNLVKNQYEYANNELGIVSNPEFMHVPMKGLPIAPKSLAIVHWNNATKETYIQVKNLPTPASDKQYQLWALVDGKPVDAGVFEVSNNEIFQKVKTVNEAQAFAVTLEPKGGSASPTLDQMYVMAKI